MNFIAAEDAALLPIQNLAWVGDAVYELYSRQRLVFGGGKRPGRESHRASAAFTSAAGQAAAAARLDDFFRPREADLLRRGRNAKGLPRTSAEYCLATGLEAVVGWLWLSGQHNRLEELLAQIFPKE